MVTSLLLIISFLLHIVTLTAIFQLFKRLKDSERYDTSEMNALFTEYINEIKQENVHLQQQLAQQKNNPPQEEKREVEKQEHISSPEIESIHNETKPQDEMKTSLQGKILQLYSKGFTPSEIAQQLNCGKTEAELTVKLYHMSSDD
ncbi:MULTISPECIES: hypothetical protein [Clostridia]|uniref:DUF6115 domain-containing protein n=1 Tax=Clostridia TaxID=186801 RepID=UPI000EA21084|nr:MULTISPECIES: hypothetical protein [Clostridia]NBJ68376.1 hypothetical protein [Roseburia sp. 1XD42-34]RKI81464.1 hypothetical protein D7V87_02650 [Clostridium sp. 1xD42-85]